MKYFPLFLILILTSCSLDKNSKYWTDKNIKDKDKNKKNSQIIFKSKNITSMSIDDFNIYVDEYIKKSEYPNIDK